MLLAVGVQNSLFVLPQVYPQLRGPVGLSLLLGPVQSASLGVMRLRSSKM